MRSVDDTHDSARTSWVASANIPGADFPIQNLPFGIFVRDGIARGGVAIGNQILDLRAAIGHGLIGPTAREAAELAAQSTLNAFMSAGPEAAQRVRVAVGDLLDARNEDAARLAGVPGLLTAQADADMLVPAAIGDYTDFLTSLHHTERNGRLKGLAVPVPPACLHLPVAYHGRASSIAVSGTPVIRPHGQWRRDNGEPAFGPSQALDFELELASWIGRGNAIGRPIPLESARQHIFGYGLLNDWSAKDLQWWEQVLGPFQGKSFLTTISPWIVTEEALAPFRTSRPPLRPDQPEPLPYLACERDREQGGLRIALQVSLSTSAMRDRGQEPAPICATSTQAMHWSVCQMVTHHTANGCNLRPGDVLGSGTLSGASEDERACLTELTQAGRNPLSLPGGERRGWLDDGDEVLFSARAEAPGYIGIGFGPCRGTIISHVAI